MQDQGRRLVVAVALALGLLLVWQKFFSPSDPKPDDGAGSAGSASTPFTPGVKATSPVGFATTVPLDAAQKPDTIVLPFAKVVVTFSSLDGTLVGWRLTDQRYAGDATHGELVPAQGGGDFLLGFTKDSTYKLPKHAIWTGAKTGDHQVTYRLSTPELDVVKTFDISPDALTLRVNVTVQPKLAPGAAAVEALALESFMVQDPAQSGGGSSRIAARVWQSSTLRDDAIVTTEVKGVIEHPRLEQNIQWTGFEHPFLLVAFAPKPGPLGSKVDKHTYADETGLMETDMVFQPTILKAGDPAQAHEIVAYLGPKNLDLLRDADALAGFPTGFTATIDLGWFGFISKPLLWLLQLFHAWVGNWGTAIVMLTILVKAATFYWTTKSMRSMKSMAVLAPQIKGLQEKYKDDKQRLQVETMALYKENGANPLSGCLPMFLQMPIWLALYRMLSTAGELYRQPFIHGWIDDLTLADPYYVLPAVLLVTMFAQARLTPQNPDPSQRTQQMIMQYGMPLMFGVMGIWFPSGLTLYIFTNTCLSALQSVYINKFDKKSIELAKKLKASQLAALEAKAAVKNAKDANPKDSSAKDEPAGAGKPRPNQGGAKKKKGRR